MGNDSGRGSRSEKPPPLATVRRLRLDEDTPASGAAADDWYETERLTGQITGRIRSGAATDKPAFEPGATMVLDWRNPDPAVDAGTAQSLRRSVDRQRRARPTFTLRVPRPHNSLRRGHHAAAHADPAREPTVSSTSTALEASGDRGDAAPQLLGFRHGPVPEPRAGRARGATIRECALHLRWGGGASIAAGTLIAAVTATVGIAVALGGSPAKPRPAAVSDSRSEQASSLAAAAGALSAVAGLMGHHADAITNAHHIVGARPSHRAVHLSHRVQRDLWQSPSSAPQPSTVTASTSSSSGSSRSSPVDGSRSASSTSSQPVTSALAPSASAQRAQPTQRAFGQNGTLGPGRGAPGTQ
jgi:hypothetical protein